MVRSNHLAKQNLRINLVCSRSFFPSLHPTEHMLKQYSFWLKTSIILQVITAAAHSMSFFFTPEGSTHQERLLIDLMQNYRTDMGAGFSPSTMNIMTAFSACFALLYLMGALVNGYLLRRKTDIETMKGIITINLVVFGVCFMVMALNTFLPPIVMTGMVFLSLIVSRLTVSKT